MNKIGTNYIPVSIAGNYSSKDKLVVISKLFHTLHSEKIKYCHWKSSEHLSASMRADTDLDLLFDKCQRSQVESILVELGFKLFTPVELKKYKDIVDYIGFDCSSGKIIHVHAHFSLTLGEAYLKSYQLNIEEKILQDRIFDEEFEIYRINPAYELVLLYIRESLKIRNRDIVKMYWSGSSQLPVNVQREYKWLVQRCDYKKAEELLKHLFDNYTDIYRYISGPFNRKELLKLSREVKKALRSNKLFSPINALLIRWYRELSIKMNRKLAKLFSIPIPTQRVHPVSGLIVAVIGADGSGKSTIISALMSTFKKKLDVYHIYFGKGRVEKKSWMRALLQGLKYKLTTRKRNNKTLQAKPAANRLNSGRKPGLYKWLIALIVAAEKRTNLRRMITAKKKGILVICDRFPQNQMKGFNDGPVLHCYEYAKNPLLRAMAKMEAGPYAAAENHSPDIVFKLVADADVLKERKPSAMTVESLKEKVDGIKELKFRKECHVVTIDASLPFDQVILTIKQAIWNKWL